MVKVLHVQGKDLKEIHPPYKFLNGDVYIIDDSKKQDGKFKDSIDKPKVYIWLGSKAYADDRGVGAWTAEQLDLAHKEIDVDAEAEGQESPEFKKLIQFQVVEGDTPGFLKHVEINYQDIDYAMYRVWDADLTDSSSTDDIQIKEVPISKASLNSDDAFVIDGWDTLYVWIGKNSQVGEKMAADRLARKLDVDRKRKPILYTINEGDEPKGFYEFIVELEKKDPKKMGSGSKQTDPGMSNTQNKKSQPPKSETKGLFSRLFGK